MNVLNYLIRFDYVPFISKFEDYKIIVFFPFKYFYTTSTYFYAANAKLMPLQSKVGRVISALSVGETRELGIRNEALSQ